MPPAPKRLPAWARQPGESWRDWDRRRQAEKAAALERKFADYPPPSGPVRFPVGVGTYDANGNPKGSGWW